jgi:hypothetical protein
LIGGFYKGVLFFKEFFATLLLAHFFLGHVSTLFQTENNSDRRTVLGGQLSRSMGPGNQGKTVRMNGLETFSCKNAPSHVREPIAGEVSRNSA